ncbi:MAG: hypothetical protein ACE5EG_02510 [Thermoanaerobaculia bacterium]
MRLLVLDGSRTLEAVVTRLVPEGVEVESASTFGEAQRRLRERPPEALIVNVSRAGLPWKELQDFCCLHDPPIPVLYESAVHGHPSEAGLERLSPSGRFLEKPYSIARLRNEIEWLMRAAAASVDPQLGRDPGNDGAVH